MASRRWMPFLKRLGEAKAIFERGQQLCSKNGQLYLWIRGSRFNKADMVFVLSVVGGDAKKNISANLVGALDYAQAMRAVICGVVGRDGGYTAQVADACVLVPVGGLRASSERESLPCLTVSLKLWLHSCSRSSSLQT